MTKQGDVSLLNDSAAQTLLHSKNLARLAYVWRDGTPRVVPMWFHWTGNEIVIGTPPTAAKLKVLRNNSPVALTIDSNDWPHKILQIRGKTQIQIVKGIVPEYAAAAERYFGAEQGKSWLAQFQQMFSEMARIVIRPEWVAVIDFEKRFPNSIEAGMSR
jgi:predicted pyridoxine 5'-phosphate oxidase superfamily flavin-nucleotide-binding protein